MFPVVDFLMHLRHFILQIYTQKIYPNLAVVTRIFLNRTSSFSGEEDLNIKLVFVLRNWNFNLNLTKFMNKKKLFLDV